MLTPGPRGAATTADLCLTAVFQEHHASGEIHFHTARKACHCFQSAAVKAQLLNDVGLAPRRPCSRSRYATCVARGRVPSLKKPPRCARDAKLFAAAAGNSCCSIDLRSHAPLALRLVSVGNLRLARVRSARCSCGWPCVVHGAQHHALARAKERRPRRGDRLEWQFSRQLRRVQDRLRDGEVGKIPRKILPRLGRRARETTAARGPSRMAVLTAVAMRFHFLAERQDRLHDGK